MALLSVGVAFLPALSSGQNFAPLPNDAPVSGRRVGTHITHMRPGDEILSALAPANAVEAAAPRPTMAPTHCTFLAHWLPTAGATGYRLDVSASPDFSSYVSEFQDRAVGNVTSYIVSGLQPATKYYYRVHAEGGTSAPETAQVMSDTTAATAGFVIVPTFDSSITSKSNAAAIEAAINRAIGLYQSIFSTPVTAHILYRYTTTDPSGKNLGNDVVGQSNYVVYDINWQTFVGALQANASSSNDNSANASLPTTALSTNIVPGSVNGRALGFNTPPSMFANGSVGNGGPYDGIVTLNSSNSIGFTRPIGGSSYDGQSTAEHETDEVIGFGSYLGSSDTNLRPQDLFSFSGPMKRNHTVTGTRYFSVDNGVTNKVGFNQNKTGDYGDWLSSCPGANLVQDAFSCTGASPDITATSPEGVNLDVIGFNLASASAPPANPLFGDISTRGFVGTYSQVLIGGFIITGSESKQVLIRALGPSLPLTGTLANPYLELHDSTGATIASNDNWQIQSDPNQVAAIEATGLEPSGTTESALLMTLQPGSYTAIVSGAGGTTGLGLVEVYDVDYASSSMLSNISTRGYVGTGNDVLIGGIIVAGTSPTSAIVLALGPSLGIGGQLADPSLTLYDGNGNSIASNNDWKSDNEAAISATGLAPTKDAESALIYDFQPGDYTAIVTGVGNTTGIGLVAAYQLNN